MRPSSLTGPYQMSLTSYCSARPWIVSWWPASAMTSIIFTAERDAHYCANQWIFSVRIVLNAVTVCWWSWNIWPWIRLMLSTRRGWTCKNLEALHTFPWTYIAHILLLSLLTSSYIWTLIHAHMAYALAFLVSDVITLTAVFRSFVSMRFYYY